MADVQCICEPPLEMTGGKRCQAKMTQEDLLCDECRKFREARSRQPAVHWYVPEHKTFVDAPISVAGFRAV